LLDFNFNLIKAQSKQKTIDDIKPVSKITEISIVPPQIHEIKDIFIPFFLIYFNIL
jgi:hypothetical protein